MKLIWCISVISDLFKRLGLSYFALRGNRSEYLMDSNVKSEVYPNI